MSAAFAGVGHLFGYLFTHLFLPLAIFVIVVLFIGLVVRRMRVGS